MTPLHRVIATAALVDDVARGATVAAVTAVVVVGLLLAGGIVLLFRRRAGAQPSSASGLPALRTRANVLLVRADEAVSVGDDELGFALAQFGEQQSAAFARTMTDARGRLAEAFRLQQALDDAVPESAQRQREWTLQIIALCEAAIAGVAEKDRGFSTLRTAEADSPARIAALRAAVDAARARLAPAAAELDRLRGAYTDALVAGGVHAAGTAAAALDAAAESVDEAGRRLSPSGVNTVAALLDDAEVSLRRATTALDGIGRLAERLDAAASALDALLESSLGDLAEAREQRDSAPDADSGAAIIRAMTAVEAARSPVAAGSGPRDVVAALDALSAAVAGLDTALATARNQAQRLEHARVALAGTLVSARSQIGALRSLVADGGRRVGADARTRLAEAERQLSLAEAEADPVEALDAARRAVTHARDGDALARYAAMRR